MKIIKTEFNDVHIINPSIFSDERGFFFETYNHKKYINIGIDTEFVQDNFSRSKKGVLRGLHYQLKKQQAKLVTVLKGEVFDVIVDIRLGSPTFNKWYGIVLSDKNRLQLFIPEGFAHGFYVLSENADFFYKCSNFYSPEDEKGIIWNDPLIAIKWPFSNNDNPVISSKDKNFKKIVEISDFDFPNFKG